MAAMTVVTVATLTAVVTAVTVLLDKKYLNIKYIQEYINFNYLSHFEFLYESVK